MRYRVPKDDCSESFTLHFTLDILMNDGYGIEDIGRVDNGEDYKHGIRDNNC